MAASSTKKVNLFVDTDHDVALYDLARKNGWKGMMWTTVAPFVEFELHLTPNDLVYIKLMIPGVSTTRPEKPAQDSSSTF